MIERPPVTDRSPLRSLIEEAEVPDAGAQDLAAADLAGQVVGLLEQALDASGLDQKDLAEKLGVTQGRVSQVFRGDGNMKIAAFARYLRAMGYEIHLSATPLVPGKPALPRPPQHERARGRRPAVTETRSVEWNVHG